ncbi:MAG: VacJ family lipoprotein, partial [Betaproteobacteria bacterium]|nr:VacJ family lipoprotein [Betaproteobacteria bacterium]
PHHREDFGQTLAVWGWENSTYLVLPLLGPSTLRDSVGLVGDYPVGLYANLHTTYTKEAEIYGFQVVNTRSNLLAATNVLEIAALDPYAFMRDAYLQQRRNLIYDGHPPPLPDDEQ